MMSDGQFTFERLEFVDADNEIAVVDPASLDAVRKIIERSQMLSKKSDEVEFAEMKKLRLINSDPRESRIYVVDFQNGYATVLSKSVMPVYQIDDLDEFKSIIQSSGTPKPNAS